MLPQKIHGETKRMILFFLFPALALYLVFFIFPSLYAFYVSFFRWKGASSPMIFAGLRNFKEILQDKRLWKVAFSNSMLILLAGGVLVFFVSFVVAGTLAAGVRGKKFFRGIIYIPSIINPVAVALVWNFLYNANWGLFNSSIRLLGFENFNFSWTSPGTLTYAIIVAMVWMYSGFYAILISSALERVPKDFIEAAQIEGASEFKIFFTIKIPLIWGVLQTAILFWCISAVKEFSLLYAWGGSGTSPADGATNMATYMYTLAFGKRSTIFRLGYATAVGVIMFLLVLVFILLVSRVMKRDNYEY